MTARTCQGCGSEIIPNRNEKNPRKWCSEACRVATYRRTSPHAETLRKSQAERARIKTESRKPPRPRCENCGKEMARRKGARFCSLPGCRSAFRRMKALSAGVCSESGCERPSTGRGLSLFCSLAHGAPRSSCRNTFPVPGAQEKCVCGAG